jgi:3-oxoadipate enol-lactonase
MAVLPDFTLTGSGPNLVLVHSLAADRHLWDDVLPALSASFQVLTYDLRGHGRALADPNPLTFDDLAADLRATLDAAGIERAHLIGLAVGGMVVQAFASSFPGRVDRLVLTDSTPTFEAQGRTIWRERANSVRATGMAALVEPTIERWFPAAFLATGNPGIARVRASVANTDPGSYAALCEAVAAVDLRERLDAIVAPTLVCTGLADQAIPPRYSELLCAGIANTTYVAWPDVGHCAPVQIPATFSREVSRFLS